MKPTFEEWRKGLPPVVGAVLVLVWTIHLARLLTGSPSGTLFALTSYWPRGAQEVYRVLTGPLLHGDGLHISLNSLAWVATGPNLEARFGTVLFAWLTLLVSLLSGLIYVGTLASFRALSPTQKDAEWTFQATVGLSGCLFALFVVEVETALEEGQPLYLFGQVKILPRMLPWIMILFVQILIPNVSFIGHLSGALLGLLLARRLGLVLVPSANFASKIDSKLASCASILPYKNAYSGENPFQISAAKSWPCLGSGSSTILPISNNDLGNDHGPRFPSGGRRLGSS